MNIPWIGMWLNISVGSWLYEMSNRDGSDMKIGGLKDLYLRDALFTIGVQEAEVVIGDGHGSSFSMLTVSNKQMTQKI